MKTSNFLKSPDVDPEVLVTIVECKEEVVDKIENESKHVLYFREFEKPLVLNWTNIEAISVYVGEENTDNWPGHQVVLFHDPSVSFKGKRTGGIRVRPAPKKAQAVQDDGPNDPIPGWDADEGAAA
jgi:hypothetical protein